MPPLSQVTPAKDVVPSSLSLRAVLPVNITINNLTVALRVKARKPKSALPAYFKGFFKQPPAQTDIDLDLERVVGTFPKKLLHNIHTSIPSGALTAILGASGSGKTSLLSSMAHRISKKHFDTTGTILYNDDARLDTIRSTYVMQHDVLLPSLTVRETLRYAAELRLPPPTTAEERHAVVEEVLLELGLIDCADTRIGNSICKGCSGGEKRRTSLAVQLLANPSVLFLDEVTTGLDATSALQLVETLKQLARQGRTIVMTLHQPRSQMWDLFDNVLLLAGGSLVYAGAKDSCTPYFAALGYNLPALVNPFEYIIDVSQSSVILSGSNFT